MEDWAREEMNKKSPPAKTGGKHGYNLTEAVLLYALNNTKSVRQAAHFLNISTSTMKRYCQKYKDADGKTLFEKYKRHSSIYTGSSLKHVISTEQILSGEKSVHPKRLLEKILRSGDFAEECSECGFCERRIIDYTVPLKIDFLDGNPFNQTKENLRILCFNCYYVMVGNLEETKKVTYDWEVD